MKLVLAEPMYLKEPINIISELVNEVQFNVTKDKIELVAMDPANVAMVIFNLLSSSFVEYDVKKEEKIAVNLDHFKQILKRVKPSDNLSLELDKNKLKVVIKGETRRVFNLALIDISKVEQKIPNLKFPVKVNINTLLLNEAIEDAGIVSDAVNFVVDNKMFIAKADGSVSDAFIEIKEDKENTISSGNAKAKYAIEYLKKFMKGAKLANNALLQFDNDYPLKLDFLVKDKMQLSFVLAPRIQNSD
ncbi:MAG: DNA polymerase sliding clamp [Nanoarchaeota archaeon]